MSAETFHETPESAAVCDEIDGVEMFAAYVVRWESHEVNDRPRWLTVGDAARRVARVNDCTQDDARAMLAGGPVTTWAATYTREDAANL